MIWQRHWQHRADADLFTIGDLTWLPGVEIRK